MMMHGPANVKNIPTHKV